MQQTASKEQVKESQKIDMKPCNSYLLCKKVAIPETIGSIVIPDSDKWQKRFEIVATSPDLIPYLDKFEVGEVVIYPIGDPTYYINIDGEDFYFLKKSSVVTKL